MKARSAKLFKINEVAQKTKLTERTLRFYESEGLLKVYHTPGGMRLYTPANLKQITELKKLVTDHKIAEVKKLVLPAQVRKPVLFVDPTVSPDFGELETDFIKVLKIDGNPIDFNAVQKKCWQFIEAGHTQFYALHTSSMLSKNLEQFSEWVEQARDFHFKIIDSHKMGLAFLPWLEDLKNQKEINFEMLKNYQEFFYIPALKLAGEYGLSFQFSPLITFDGEMKVVNRDLSPEGYQNWLKEAEASGKKVKIFTGAALSPIHRKHLGEQAVGIVQY